MTYLMSISYLQLIPKYTYIIHTCLVFNKLTPCLLPLVYTKCNWLMYASCIGHLPKPLASDTCLSHPLSIATCLSQLYICHLHMTPVCATCTSNLLLATCTTLTPQYKYHYTGQLIYIAFNLH